MFNIPAPPPGGFPSKLSQQITPAPKSKVKKLQWTKISSDKVTGKANVWTTVGKMFPDYQLNYDEVEQLFGVAEPSPLGATMEGSLTDGKDGVGHSEKKKKSEEVCFIKKSLP